MLWSTDKFTISFSSVVNLSQRSLSTIVTYVNSEWEIIDTLSLLSFLGTLV